MYGYRFGVHSDIVVTGHDYESADYSNPEGNVYGEAFYVVMERDDGARWAHDHSFVNDQDGAFRLLHSIEVAYDKFGRKALHPDHWVDMDPMYGSEAYVAQGTEYQRWEAERQEARGGALPPFQS